MPEVYTERRARTPRSPRAVLRGLAAVAALFAGAADALVSAFLGVPRLGWLAQRAGEAAADEYRRAASGAIDAELIDDDPAPAGTAAQQEGDT
jgi:hypothetical protein